MQIECYLWIGSRNGSSLTEKIEMSRQKYGSIRLGRKHLLYIWNGIAVSKSGKTKINHCVFAFVSRFIWMLSQVLPCVTGRFSIYRVLGISFSTDDGSIRSDVASVPVEPTESLA